MKRRNSGATLAFVAGSIIFIVIVALAFYFLSQLLGGGRELQAATNSGTLNVAKQAVVQSVAIPSGNQTAADMKAILMGQLPTGRVDLRSFNSMVGSAMLVAMNAEADGNDDSVTDAQSFLDLVEGVNGGGGGAPSAGQALHDSLSNGSSWAKNFFDQTANGNSLRMLGDNPSLTWQNGDFKVGYYNANQPSNISLNNFSVPNGVNNMPFNNIAALGESITASALVRAQMPTDSSGNAASATDNNTHDTLLLGYRGLNFSKLGRQLYAVPLDTQPHLVSLTDFGSGTATTQPGAGDRVVLPPNAFMNGATARDQRKSNKDVHMLAAAMAGYNSTPTPLGFTYGYIVLDNHLSKKWSGLIPSGDTVFAQELGSPGITVDDHSGYFERGDEHQVEDWQNTRRDVDKNGNPGFNPDTDGPAWDKIFTNSGDAPQNATQVSQNIPYHGSNTTCNHSNSDASSPGAASQCVNGTTAPPGTDLCPFDKAFHPNRPPSNSSNPLDLTAAEQTGCMVMDLWAKATNNQISAPYNANFNLPPTGLGLYPQGHNPINGQDVPWTSASTTTPGFPDHSGDSYSDPNVPCKVTKAGNFAQLIDQTAGGTPDYSTGQPTTAQSLAVAEIIKQRMHEILPSDDATIDTQFKNLAFKPIPIGTALFIYLDPAQQYKKFTSSPNPPPWLNSGGLMGHVFRDPSNPGGDGVDGKDVVIKNQVYGVTMTMADPNHQFGIHDTPFIHINGEPVSPPGSHSAVANGSDPYGNGSINAHDQIFVNSNSGAFGNLLNVTFSEFTDGNGIGGPGGGGGFTDRD